MAIDPDVQVLLDDILKRLEALEKSQPAAAVHPHTVTEEYEGGSKLIYKVQP